MKTSVFPHMVATVLLGMTPLSAQNPVSASPISEISTADAVRGNSARHFSDSTLPPGTYVIPPVEKVRGELPEDGPVYALQGAGLSNPVGIQQRTDAVVDLSILRNPSAYRAQMVKTGPQPYSLDGDSLQKGLEQISALYRQNGKSAGRAPNCSTLAVSVGKRIELDSAKLLEIVDSEVAANPTCACEVVKIAIKASEADVPQVVAIVEAAIHASPENMRIVSQCAIATAPAAIAAVQALLAELDPNSGEEGSYSAKSAKSAKGDVAAIIAPETPNSLDHPVRFPPFVPPIVPPYVSQVNPRPIPVCPSR